MRHVYPLRRLLVSSGQRILVRGRDDDEVTLRGREGIRDWKRIRKGHRVVHVLEEPACNLRRLRLERVRGRFRSRTCVAPRDLRKSVLCSEAVVTMGENPERRANWMTVAVQSAQ